MSKLTHLDERGAARMVDVSGKESSAREAEAEAIIVLSPDAYQAVMSATAPKGDVLAAARISAIMAAKRTSELIPLCHPIPLSSVAIEIEPLQDRSALRIVAFTKTKAETGVEMEALTAVTIAALTIYDMTKAIGRGTVIESVRLLAKSGGKSGVYSAPARRSAAPTQRPRAAPSALLHEAARARPAPAANDDREALRAFMAERHLRAPHWANEAGVPAAQIFAFLTGRARTLPAETAQALARAARVRVEDLFARRGK
jgi:cyclic pyranopterin phosphate synthase